jgi:glucokinase
VAKNSDTLVLGIDLGGTKILSAVVNDHGGIVARDHSVTPAALGQEAVIEAIIFSVHRVLDQAGLPLARLAAVGIGAPGPLNPETGILFTAPNLPGWHDVPLRDIIERKLGLKGYLVNDANAAAFGEFFFGAGRGSRNLVYITVSTGIGGGIIVDGKLYSGANGSAAELGHMTIDDDGPLCNCGNKGCWEVLASGTAMARNARDQIRAGRGSTILDLAGGDLEKVTARIIHTAALQGDALARELISRTAYYLGVGLGNIINIFNPEVIVIGGGVSLMGEILLKPAWEIAGSRAYKDAFLAARFLPAALGRDSGVLGAAAMALQMSRQP